MPELKDSMDWQWCSDCEHWHKKKEIDLLHQGFSQIIHSPYTPEQPPVSENFDGTVDELHRFATGYRLLQEDRRQALVEFEHRIDLEIKRRANA